MNYSLEILTPCPCGKSNLSRAWHSANSICIECMACGKKGPLSDGVTMVEAKIKSHQLWNQQVEKVGGVVSKPETKTVLGREFSKHPRWWQCQLSGERSLRLEQDCNDEHIAILFDDDAHVNIETGRGLSEADAILALQATLRKMAELEVVE